MHSNYVTYSKDLIKRNYLNDRRPWVIGYSGGKDSTTLVQIVLESIFELKNDKKPVDKQVFVISSDTLVETPLIINQISKTLDGVNEFGILNELPITAHIVRPKVDQTFWANIIGRGYPSPNQTFRWCTDRMKIDPANEFIKGIFVVANLMKSQRNGE
jgi:DNA sulfur modification protein DndC